MCTSVHIKGKRERERERIQSMDDKTSNKTKCQVGMFAGDRGDIHTHTHTIKGNGGPERGKEDNSE